eukprot:1136553-Pelagomonas_calceolata.AAC.1
MGIRRVARHAPGCRDSPSPILRRCAPSTPPPEAPVKTKSMSSVNDSGYSLNGMFPKLGC